MKIRTLKHSQAAQTLFLFGLSAVAAFAQSGDVDTSSISTLGSTILKLLISLAGMAFVGLVIWGGITLTTNRPKGLAMIGGGLGGALIAGLSFLWVNHLDGRQHFDKRNAVDPSTVEACLIPRRADDHRRIRTRAHQRYAEPRAAAVRYAVVSHSHHHYFVSAALSDTGLQSHRRSLLSFRFGFRLVALQG